MKRTSIEMILMDRFELTEEDLAAAEGKFFDAEGRLSILPAKEKNKAAIYILLAACFDLGRTYAEKEVNLILIPAVEDYASFRRALVDHGLLSRSRDGRTYWRNA
ncbi:MAG: DUF2087 domain-containing protein [Candidatus Izemoplasmatales bacterium]